MPDYCVSAWEMQMARLNKSMNVALSAVVLIALAGCGKKTEDDSAATTANAPAAGTAAPASAAAPAKDSIDTLDGKGPRVTESTGVTGLRAA